MKKFTILMMALIAMTNNTNAQWQQGNGTAGKKVTCFTSSGTNIFAGTYDGVLLSANNGTDWSATGMTSDVYAMTVCGSYIFAGNESNGMAASTNNGTTWTDANNGLTPGSNFIALTTSGTNIFAGGNGIYLSIDNGANWIAKNNGLTNTSVTSIIAMSPYLTLGTNGGGVFLTSDNGDNWSAGNNGLTNLSVKALAFTSTYDLFAGTDGGGAFLYNVGTSSWSAVNNGLSNLNVNAFATNGSNIYAGTQGGGIFMSTDNGANWISVNTGLPNNDILSLAVAGTYLLAGTTSEGVWVRSLSEMTGIAETNLNSGFALYPNPASDYITININNQSNTCETLNIYNTIGELVKTELFKENQQQINVKDLVNGIYVVEFKSNNGTEKQKLIIQR